MNGPMVRVATAGLVAGASGVVLSLLASTAARASYCLPGTAIDGDAATKGLVEVWPAALRLTCATEGADPFRLAAAARCIPLTFVALVNLAV